LQGLGAGATGYENVLDQQQRRASEAATATTNLSNIPQGAPITQIQPGTNKISIQGRPDFLAGQTLTGMPTPGAQNAPFAGTVKPPAAPPTPPVPVVASTTPTGGYNYTVGPSSSVDKKMLDQYGADQSGKINPYVIQQKIAMQPALAAQAENDAKIVQQLTASSVDARNTTSDLNNLGASINNLPQGGLYGTGWKSAERQGIASAIQVAKSTFGLSGDPISDADLQNLSDKELINKIQTLSSGQIAQGQGMHAGYVAQAIKSALPGGEIQQGTSNKILAGMYIAKQADDDFRNYSQNYVKKYGTSLGAYQSFRQEMDPVYARDRNMIMRVLEKPKDKNGQPMMDVQTPLQRIKDHPEEAAKLDKKVGASGAARYFVGGG
jgi:hypothetical protein